VFTVRCQYITLRFLGDNPPASYVFLPSLFNIDHCNIPPQNRVTPPGRHLVPSSAMEPMHPFCTVQWMICNYQDECFHVLRSGLKSAASSASYSHLHHLAVRDSTHRSPSGRHTKAIMTTASTCRSLWISPNLELRLNTHSQ
jgi:hypothetical protein